jgi:hypothetical protein
LCVILCVIFIGSSILVEIQKEPKAVASCRSCF